MSMRLRAKLYATTSNYRLAPQTKKTPLNKRPNSIPQTPSLNKQGDSETKRYPGVVQDQLNGHISQRGNAAIRNLMLLLFIA
jgi:hypothetical protein